jgi:Uma2 family endonuclease
MAPSLHRFHQDISRSIFLDVCNHLEKRASGIAYNAPFDPTWTFSNPTSLNIRNHESLIEHGAQGAPDPVVEILSPSTEKYDLYQKRVVYARTGDTELWIVDPMNFEMRVFQVLERILLPIKRWIQNSH